MNHDDDATSYSSSESSSSTSATSEALDAAVEEAMAECLAQMQREEAAVAEQIHRSIRRRRSVRRDHAAAHERLVADYFADQPRWGPTVFRRRFRMSRYLFLSINVRTLSSRDEYFTYRADGVGRPGLTPLQKCTAALRQLAYGTTADIFDEYLHVGETTSRECLKRFCRGVEAYGDTYLCKPTTADCQGLMKMHETTHDFPMMLGSIECMYWQWKKCPTAWRRQFTSGYKGSHPTMILEAVADHWLWIWHASLSNVMATARPSSSLPTGANTTWGTTSPMAYTHGGLFLLRRSASQLVRRGLYLRKSRSRRGRMSSGHLMCSKHGGQL